MSFPTLLIHTNQPEQSVFHNIPFTNSQSNPDLIWINKDDLSITIEKIREIHPHLSTRPYQEDRKIIIILDLEQAQIPAQNALLKSLEEPPDYVQFILTTRHPELLLGTIRSRCIIIKPEKNEEQSKLLAPDIKGLTITEKIQLAEKVTKEGNQLQFMYQLLGEKKQQFEKNPDIQIISEIKAIQKTIEMLQANTNTRLCLEWCFFKIL